MISVKKISQVIALAALFGGALYAGVYFMASRSEGFQFIEQKIKNSQAIKARVGDIKEIRPSLLGSYDQKTVGSDEWVTMTIKVAGAAKTIELDVKAKKTNGTWALEVAKSGEQKFDLN